MMLTMTNGEAFLYYFGIYATELWAMPEQQLLEWLNAPCDRERLNDMLSAQLNEAHNEGYDVGYWAGRRDYEQKWIPVTERLPEKDGLYFVSGNSEIWMCELIHIGATKGWSNPANRPRVKAWMPLPEPYKESE